MPIAYIKAPAGDYIVTIDGVDSTVSVSETATVTAPSISFSPTSATVTEGTIGTLATVTIDNGGDAGATVTLSNTVAEISGTSLMLTNAAVTGDTGQITVTITNSAGSASATFNLTVEAVGVNSHTATVSDFPTDDLKFDSGYLRGTNGTDRNSAAIPISGAVADGAGGALSEGATIEARVVSIDDSGATTTSWTTVDTPSAGATTWSGTLDLPRSASRYRAEVRVQGSNAAAASQTTSFAVGHVFVILGQSEHQRIGDAPQQSALTSPTLAQDGRVSVAWRTNTESDPVQYAVLENASFDQEPSVAPYSPAVAAMANAFMEMRPDDHFTIIFQTKGATNLTQLANDSNTARSWAEDLDIINAGTGNQITGFGGVMLDWTAGPGSWGIDYDQAFGRFFTKRLPDGTPMIAGDTYTSADGQNTITFDHYWADLDADVPVLPYGPHRFETENSSSDPAGATQNFASAEFETVGGNLTGPMALKRMTRQSMGDLVNYPNGNFLAKGMSPLLYRNGDAGSTIPWADYAHPGKLDGNQGLPLWAAQNAYVVGEMMGWQSWTRPIIEAQHVTWEPSGAYVEVDIGQTISTVALEEGDLSADVAGFEVSGRDAAAEIVAGKIRVYHPDGTFTGNDTLRFGMGGASGVTAFIDDIANEIWKRWPMVAGTFTAEYAAGETNPGIAVEPVMDWDTVFANPLGLLVGSSTITDATTEWADNSYPDRTTTPWSGVTDKLTMQIRFEVASGWVASSYRNFISYGTLDPVSLSIHSTNGRVRVRARDTADTGLIVIDAATINFDTDTMLTFAVDFSEVNNGKMWLRDGAGTLLWSATSIVQNGALDRDVFRLFADDVQGTLHHAVFWTDCTADGTAPPLADAYRIVSGSASTVNAHEWKLGADAT